MAAATSAYAKSLGRNGDLGETRSLSMRLDVVLVLASEVQRPGVCARMCLRICGWKEEPIANPNAPRNRSTNVVSDRKISETI